MCGGDQVEDISEDGERSFGKPREHDPKFKGPLAKRSCTDIICCIIFLVCVAGLAVCSILGYARGDPVKLVYPTDSFGNVCGSGAYESKPYLVFFDLTKCAQMGASVVALGCPTPQVCVSSCPTDYWVYLQTVAIETANGSNLDATERAKMICKYSVDPSAAGSSVTTMVNDEDCAAYYVKSTAVINRCIPSIFLEVTNLASVLSYTFSGSTYNIQSDTAGSNVTGTDLQDASYYLALFYEAKEFVELIYRDVVNAWWMILVGFAMAILLCMIWIVLMRWIAGIMVWITVGLLFVILIFSIYYSYSEYYDLKSLNATSEIGVSQAFALNFSYYLSLKQTWLAFGCTLSTITLILILIFIFLVKRICIAIELIKEASRAVGNMFSTLFWPVVPFFLQVIFVAYWAVSAVYVASMGGSEYYSNTTNVTTDSVNYYLSRIPCDSSDSNVGSVCDFVKYGGDEYIIPMQVFMLFMFLWVMNFIIALSQITLAGAFSSYYWAFNKPDDIPAFPLLWSFYRAFRYHLGSLAFGSFIIAVIQMVRIILEYIDSKLKGSENRAAKFLLKCLKCCFWCLEKLLKFLNKNAYILIAIRGKNFCFSAKDAFFLIMRNIVRVLVLDKVTDFVLFLSKIVCTMGVFVGAFFWFKGKITWFDDYVNVPSLNYYLTPVIILTIGTYFLACVFFSVYSMAVDTLFLCFLEDLEMNDGSPEKPYYMSKSMMSIMGKKNKEEKPEKADKEEKKKKKKKVKEDKVEELKPGAADD
ncbi:choline transporter-like protein 2 [Babylonia areolata]|uniref:choline transporter-like protein 2 n=1 Tax=Babylonia areolata TaxID=304850 RepID=UPI003FD321D3